MLLASAAVMRWLIPLVSRSFPDQKAQPRFNCVNYFPLDALDTVITDWIEKQSATTKT